MPSVEVVAPFGSLLPTFSGIRCREHRRTGSSVCLRTRAFECLKTSLQSNDWVVYTKAPFAGAANVLAYLGRYTHKSAIANHRLVDFDGERVRFRWRDYAHANKLKVMRLDAGEFIRRFLLHVFPNRHIVAFRRTPRPRPRRERPLKARGEGRAAGGLVITREVM